MTDVLIPNFTPREYQLPLWEYLENGGKRAVAVWHRRSGKDEMALHWACYAAFVRPGNYWHMLPEAAQCRKAIWQAVNPHTGKRRIDEAFPPELGCRQLENEMLVQLPNGATWQLIGSDSYQNLIGSTPAGLTFSEYATSNPNALAFLSPILVENNGWMLVISTPRGFDNHLYKIYEHAKTDPEWFAEILPATKTGVFTPEQLETEKQNLVSLYGADQGDALFRSEYMASFSASVIGSYYGRLIEDADQEGRIRRIPHDPQLPVITAWDLGTEDATAIWFLQQSGREIWAIDYCEQTNEGADYFARILKEKRYTYGTHIFPHDAKQREWGSGARSRLETLASLGVRPQQVLTNQAVADGISAVRMILPRMYFDSVKCKRGLECLRNYSRKWDDVRKVYADKPLHDQYSHGSDALRTYAMGNHRTGPKQQIKYPDLGIT